MDFTKPARGNSYVNPGIECGKDFMANETGTLLCLPDISGFTRFMSEVDHDLASKVIPALLNEIIYANTIGLKVSEIEGDAVFFYKTGPLPTFEALIGQCLDIFKDFYGRLEEVRSRYQTNDQADRIPEMLGLKIILHYGAQIGTTQIGNRIKLIGEDVIIAHKLMKNRIPNEEYLLMTETLLHQFPRQKYEQHALWKAMEREKEDFAHLSKVAYHYYPNPREASL